MKFTLHSLNFKLYSLIFQLCWKKQNVWNAKFNRWNSKITIWISNLFSHFNFWNLKIFLWIAIFILWISNFILWISNFIFIRPSSDGTFYGMVMSVRPSDSPSGSPSARFPHFSHICVDILSWNFAHDFVLMYYRSSLSVVTLHQLLKELYLFVNLE